MTVNTLQYFFQFNKNIFFYTIKVKIITYISFRSDSHCVLFEEINLCIITNHGKSEFPLKDGKA